MAETRPTLPQVTLLAAIVTSQTIRSLNHLKAMVDGIEGKEAGLGILILIAAKIGGAAGAALQVRGSVRFISAAFGVNLALEMKRLNLKPLFTAVKHSGYFLMLSIDSSVLLKA